MEIEEDCRPRRGFNAIDDVGVNPCALLLFPPEPRSRLKRWSTSPRK
jgi:hypothetical protein